MGIAVGVVVEVGDGVIEEVLVAMSCATGDVSAHEVLNPISRQTMKSGFNILDLHMVSPEAYLIFESRFGPVKEHCLIDILQV
jgi:hypothetical protein